MIGSSNSKKRNNTVTCIQEYNTLQHLLVPCHMPTQEDQEVSFQANSLKMDLNKEEESTLFCKVLTFVNLLMQDSSTWAEAKQHFTKYSKNLIKIGSEHKNQKLLSFKKMNVGSKICFEAEAVPIKLNEIKKNCRSRMNKKISLLIAEEQFPVFQKYDQSSNQSSSESSLKTIRSIDIKHMPMNLQTITAIYDSPQPFLINLSLCIFTRYCIHSRRKVVFGQSSWVLCVATIIAYKFYYDEQIQGLIDCFTGIMSISRQDLIDLQRCFLQEIDYMIIVRNYDYYYMLNKLLKIQVPNSISQDSKKQS